MKATFLYLVIVAFAAGMIAADVLRIAARPLQQTLEQAIAATGHQYSVNPR